MATLAYSFAAKANNSLCSSDATGWLTVPVVSLALWITPISLIIISIAALFIHNPTSVATYKRDWLWNALCTYLFLTFIVVLYKVFACKRTRVVTQNYTKLSQGSKIN